MLREYGVDTHLLLVVKSLYSCSKVCVRVGGVTSQLFTLVIVYMNWIDNHNQVDVCVIVGSCMINRLLFANDLVYCLHPLNSVLNMRLIDLLLRAIKNENY